MSKFEKEATKAYEAAFERKVARVGHPAGRRKKSIRLFLDGGGSVIATKRRTPDQAELEVNVLRALHAHDAAVPEVLAFDGNFLFQEDLGKTRLSRVLTTASPAKAENMLDSALTSLARIHEAAKSAGLKRHVMTLDSEEWRANLLAVPQKLGAFLELPPPDLPMEKLDQRLRVPSPEFVKWDARPPNAILHEDGQVSWIDWEHCGRRNRMDDLVWLFGDQSCPDFPDVEQRLLDRHLPAFVDDMAPDDARDYLWAYGALHMCIRLGLTLNSSDSGKNSKGWKGILADNVNLLATAHRTSIQASRWAKKSELTADLAPWLLEVARQIESARQSHNDRRKSRFDEDWESWVRTNIDQGLDKNFIFQTLLDAEFDYHLIKDKMEFEPTPSEPSAPSDVTVPSVSPATDASPMSVGSLRDALTEQPIAKRRPSKKTLTIGMATYDDYNGVYFTLQSLRLHHPEVQDRVEYLIIDNNPESSEGEACKKIARLTGRDGNVPRCRYLPFDAVQGTAAARNELFVQAETPFAMCVDCHVLFAPGVIGRFLDYIDRNPETVDLLQGVLLYDDMQSVSTHFAPTFDDGTQRWSGGMLGQWATDDRGRDPDAEPFEIPMQGLGVFAMKKDAWPGFNRHFKGFGGEEGYIHEKVRRRGGRTLCLPFLRWLHRFNRPQGVPYANVWADRIHNYVIGHRENGLDEEPIREHFATLIGKKKVDELLNDLADFDPLG